MTEDHASQEAETAQKPEIDAAAAELAMENFRAEQNITGAVLAGLVAALAGAGVWTLITVLTEYQIGWMAVGVGFLVGMAVRFAGKGLDMTYGVIGATLALLGCLLGNLFTVCWFVAEVESMTFMEVVSSLNFGVAVDMVVSTFAPMDLLFYGIAVYEGFKLSIRPITEEQLRAAVEGGPEAV